MKTISGLPLLIPMIFFLALLPSHALLPAECDEQGDYLVCEDWDSGTPPNPWPAQRGSSWHGWKPASYGEGTQGEVTASRFHSPGRCLMLLKDDGKKSTVDLSHDIPGKPTKIHIRFYLYIPSGEMRNIGSFAHFIFLNSTSSANCALDFRGRSSAWLGSGNGENGKGYEWNGHLMLAPHTYNKGENWVVETEGTPFFWEDHGDEWVLVEWRVDFVGKTTSLWINEKLYVDEYKMEWPHSSAGSITFSGFTLNTSGRVHYYIDDVVVSTKYIGPRGRTEPRQVRDNSRDRTPNGKPKQPTEPNVHFYWDCENQADGSILPNPPFWFGWKFVGSSTGRDIVDHPGLCAQIERGPTPQGEKYLQWKITDEDNHGRYTEVKGRSFPIRCTLGKTYYLAYYFNFTRINGRDIWRERGQSADKGVELSGSGIRWCVSRGHWGGGYARNKDHRYTVWLGNPTYHLNRELEHTDAYYPNKSGYSNKNPIQLDYERWYSCVMAVKMAADKTGSVAVWIDGTKLCEYENIKTCANANPSITQITMGGTIAQPAYDAPAHYRKFDALLLTDNWQNIINLGHLKHKQESKRK